MKKLIVCGQTAGADGAAADSVTSSHKSQWHQELQLEELNI